MTFLFVGSDSKFSYFTAVIGLCTVKRGVLLKMLLFGWWYDLLRNIGFLVGISLQYFSVIFMILCHYLVHFLCRRLLDYRKFSCRDFRCRNFGCGKLGYRIEWPSVVVGVKEEGSKLWLWE